MVGSINYHRNVILKVWIGVLQIRKSVKANL